MAPGIGLHLEALVPPPEGVKWSWPPPVSRPQVQAPARFTDGQTEVGTQVPDPSRKGRHLQAEERWLSAIVSADSGSLPSDRKARWAVAPAHLTSFLRLLLTLDPTLRVRQTGGASWQGSGLLANHPAGRRERRSCVSAKHWYYGTRDPQLLPPPER